MKSFADILSEPEKPWETYLEIDALYLHAARQALGRALEAEDEIRSARDRWELLEHAAARILEEHGGDEFAASDELEPIYVQFEDAHYQIGKAYAPLLKEVAIVHMLSAGALEAHINARARESLGVGEFKSFEKLAVDAKWLFLPKILGCPGFNKGHQPMQGFSKLIRYRNELIHYKEIMEEWVYGEVPTFLSKLGLTIPDAKQSIASACDMIEEFARQRGVEAPHWLRADLSEMSYFEISRE